ncbi:MAG: nucleic acid-binding protein [Clostridiales bacterium GWF2_38_85]|nr:MAG: nucleic acid-binding protein [Clostridiales bacterium GWF2_38_85]HBL85316.1 DUF448 domain-containing protein [Clostridiales bacterium]
MEPNKKNSPLRKCIGCNEMKDKKSLIRIVKEPDGNIMFDKAGKKNGRGAYVCSNVECFLKAKKLKRIEKNFKCQVSPQVYEELEAQFKQN